MHKIFNLNDLSDMKLKSFATLLCGLAAMSLVFPSCTKNDDDNIDLIPVKLSKNGNWSMMNKKGEIVYQDEFKNAPTLAINGVFSVEEGDFYTLYKMGDKKPEVVKGCDKLKSVGMMEDGLIPVTPENERISVIDSNGKKKFTLNPIKNQEVVACHATFSDGLLAVEIEDGKCGYVDKSGKVVISPKYNDVAPFDEGLALVGKTDADTIGAKETFYVINKKGEEVFKLKEDYEPVTSQFVNGRIIVRNEDTYYVFDKKGEKTKLSSKIKAIDDCNEDYIIFRNDEGQFGLMDYKGETIIRAKYQNLLFADGDEFIAQRDGDDGEIVLIDKKGEVKKTIDYKEVRYIKSFGYMVKEGSTYTLLDDGLKPKTKEEIYEYNLATAPSFLVETDYFDVVGVAKKLISMIGADGIGKYKFDMSASQIMNGKEPREYTYSSEVQLDDLNVSGFRYDINVQAAFNATLADYSYDYSSYESRYYWNPASRLAGFMLNLSTQAEWGEKGFNAISSALKDAGYKLAKKGTADSNSYAAVYTKGSIAVYFTSPAKGMGCQVIVASTKLVPDILNNMKNNINENGKISDYTYTSSVPSVLSAPAVDFETEAPAEPDSDVAGDPYAEASAIVEEAYSDY